MPLYGSLKEIQLPDMLQFFALQRKSGKFTVRAGSLSYVVVISKGFIDWLVCQEKGLDFLALDDLKKKKKISQQKYEEIVKIASEVKNNAYNIINDYGLYDIEILKKSMIDMVYDITNKLLTLEEGEYEFVQPDRNISVPMKLHMGIESVLLENMRQMDEWKNFMQVFHSLDTVPILKLKEIDSKDFKEKTVTLKPPEPKSEKDIEENETSIIDKDLLFKEGVAEDDPFEEDFSFEDTNMHEVLSHHESSMMYVRKMIDGKRNLAMIVDISNLGEYQTLKIVYELFQKDYIELKFATFSDVVEEIPTLENANEKSNIFSQRILVYIRVILLAAVLLIYIIINLKYRIDNLGLKENEKNNSYIEYKKEILKKNVDLALDIYYFRYGFYPESENLVALSDEKIIESDLILNFLENKFEYDSKSDYYIIKDK